jgi:hypothetical protein
LARKYRSWVEDLVNEGDLPELVQLVDSMAAESGKCRSELVPDALNTYRQLVNRIGTEALARELHELS